VPRKMLTVDFDEKRIDTIFAELDQCHLPGAAVGIAIGGKPVYRKGFGLASMELPVTLSPTIRMAIASVSKQFTCLAYMLLCEEGKAGINDTVGKHFAELHPSTHEVTMRQLMGHLGGLRDVLDICYQFSGTGKPISSADQLSFYRTIEDVNFAPGTAWNYSGGGYLMLTIAIERITGKPLHDVLRERIFEPIGMHDTALIRWDTEFVPNCATSHMTTMSGGFEKSYLGAEAGGGGGLVSSIDDMLRWLAHMDSPIVGCADTWKAMKAPLRLANGTSTGYGLGIVTDNYRGAETLSHSGWNMGNNAHVLKMPSAGLDIVVILNRHEGMAPQLVRQILDACVPGLDTVKSTLATGSVTGFFRSPTTDRIIQLYAKNGQQIASIDGWDWEVASAEDGVLRPVAKLSFFQLAVTPRGDPERPASIRFSDFGNEDELISVPPGNGGGIKQILGQYRSETAGTTVNIVEAETGLRLQTVGRFGSALYLLECLADGVWRAKSTTPMPWGGVLLFDENLGAFRYTTGRIRALLFRRVK
jgi:D-aminopeptidase